MDSVIRKEAVEAALECFVELPLLQRSVVILKDVLGESLAEIAALLDLTVDAVKGHLARGRARLRQVDLSARRPFQAGQASGAVVHYVTLFNQRDWEGLRLLLAEDVKLSQATHPMRCGAVDVGMFFTTYARQAGIWLAPAWLEGQEVVAVFENIAETKPAYFMRLDWTGDRITFIHDYRYVRYVMDDAELMFGRTSART